MRNLHNDPLPVGLFIPFKSAWLAVKEFIETDGALPKSIEWVANKDLPAGTFPDPGSPHLAPLTTDGVVVSQRNDREPQK